MRKKVKKSEIPTPNDHLVIADDPMTIVQLAKYLQVSVGTVRRLVYTKKIPTVRVGRQLRFLPQDVILYLRGA